EREREREREKERGRERGDKRKGEGEKEREKERKEEKRREERGIQRNMSHCSPSSKHGQLAVITELTFSTLTFYLQAAHPWSTSLHLFCESDWSHTALATTTPSTPPHPTGAFVFPATFSQQFPVSLIFSVT